MPALESPLKKFVGGIAGGGPTEVTTTLVVESVTGGTIPSSTTIVNVVVDGFPPARR
jgi:hypothetical protein